MAFLCLSLIYRPRGSGHISTRVPSCPEHRQEGSLPVSSSTCFNLWNLLFPVPEPNGTLTLPAPCLKLSWLLLPPTHRCILILRVHRNQLGSARNANSGSGGLRRELNFCVSDKLPLRDPSELQALRAESPLKTGACQEHYVIGISLGHIGFLLHWGQGPVSSKQ
jgi:hypothetical protein